MQGNVLILTYWSFDDALIQTYTLPYLRIIRKLVPPHAAIHLITLEKNPAHLKGAALDERRQKLERDGIRWVPLKYRPFGGIAIAGWMIDFFRLAILTIRQHISVIHCWGTPAGSIGYGLSVLTRRKLIIDSYEPHAEAMVENGTWKRSGLAFRILFLLEKWQTRRAAILIAANAGMKEYAHRAYGFVLNGMLIKPACVDLDMFRPKPEKDLKLLRELGLEDKRIVVYAGKFGGIYLDREVFAFFKAAAERWGDRFRALVLTNHAEHEIAALCSEAHLDRAVIVTRFVPHSEVKDYLDIADFALTPVKPVPTKRYCTPIKDGEYWAMGLPVVIPEGISNDSGIIRERGIGAVLDRLDTAAFRSALDTMDTLLAQPREELRMRIRDVASTYRSFTIAEQVYKEIYGR